MTYALAQLSADPVLNTIYAAVLGFVAVQAIGGALFLFGFVAIMRRFMDKEIPAQLDSVNKNLATIHADLEKLTTQLGSMQREVDRHAYRLENLEGWRKDTLDDTRSGGHLPGGQRRR